MKKVLIILALFTLAGVAYLKASQFFKIDDCLDQGGRWNYDLAICEFEAASASPAAWHFDKVEGSSLVFKDGQRLETHLFELAYIGQISVDNQAPYLIFSGRDCDGCGANIAVYIHSPANGRLIVDQGQNRYQYPGIEKDYLTDSVLYTARAFYGQVLENVYGVIWYENRRLENGEMGQSVFLSRLTNGALHDTTFEDRGEIAQTLALYKQGLCAEIEGQTFTSEP